MEQFYLRCEFFRWPSGKTHETLLREQVKASHPLLHISADQRNSWSASEQSTLSVFQPSPLTVWKLQKPACSLQLHVKDSTAQEHSEQSWLGEHPRLDTKLFLKHSKSSFGCFSTSVPSCPAHSPAEPAIREKGQHHRPHQDLLCSGSRVIHFRLAEAEEVGRGRLGKGHRMCWFLGRHLTFC